MTISNRPSLILVGTMISMAVFMSLMTMAINSAVRSIISDSSIESLGANVTKSERSEYLMRLAMEHAESMASRGQQDHSGFGDRAKAMADSGLLNASEICAESWEHQADLSEEDLWAEAFRCWRESPGHWAVASKVHKYYGYAMAQGANNIWYFCIITSE